MEDKPRRKSFTKDDYVEVYRRDKWLCYWCRRPVIFAPTLRLMALVAEEAAKSKLPYHHKNWKRKLAPLLDELGVEVDHKIPLNNGGEDTFANLCTSCHRCNLSKSDSIPEQWKGKPTPISKRRKSNEPVDWDGLSYLFIALAQTHRDQLNAGEEAWLESLAKDKLGPSLNLLSEKIE